MKKETKYKSGDKVRVTGQTCGHSAGIGSIIILDKPWPSASEKNAWRVKNANYYITESEFTKVNVGKTNFILKYDLDSDPVEEWSTLEQVKERIGELVKNKDKNRLKLDSIVVYKVEKVMPIKVETKVEIIGI